MGIETHTPPPEVAVPRWRAGLNRTIVVLGLTSLCTDVSSEMLMPIRFLFLVRWLGTPLVLAALIEGLAETAASLLKVVVGRRVDRVGRRRPLILAGYSLSNLTKPLIGFVATWQPALALIMVDRVGKALRVAPRDALLAESVAPRYRGKAFGFHRSMDTLGAAIGPLITAGIISVTAGDIPAVFRWTIVPGVLAILVLALFLREPRTVGADSVQPNIRTQPNISRATSEAALPLGRTFWIFTLIWTLFSLGNSSDSFVFLRSVDLDSQLIRVPLYYAGFNIIYALAATPLGALSDRIGRLPLLFGSVCVFALVYAGWGAATQSWQFMALFLIYGLYYAATEGVARAFVVDMVDPSRKGAALGWFMALTGIAVLPANLAAAYLWNTIGQSAPFWYGAVVALVAAIALAICARWLRPRPVAQAIEG